MFAFNPFPLTAVRLRFNCVAETPIQLGGLRAGSNLRGALLNVMRRATCAGDPDEAAHLAVCPVCWLAAARDHPGQERRGYSLTPPVDVIHRLEPGQGFDFRITLFGDAGRYLPYFVLAVPETGRVGVGLGRGKFALKSINAEYPLAEDWPVLQEGANIVYPPQRQITHADVLQAAGEFCTHLDGKAHLRMEFLTPLRLILDERLLKSPDFGAIFNHLLRRVDEVAMQYADADERPMEERQFLWRLADRVRLVESQTHWEEVASGSSRTGQPTWISGLVGAAWYSAPIEVWEQLLPWLIWGEIVQVGKDTAKGNGVFRIKID